MFLLTGAGQVNNQFGPCPPREQNNIMATWLKLIGSAKGPITEWAQEYVGFRKKTKPSIRTGYHLFSLRTGR
jgi:hypothetical protein